MKKYIFSFSAALVLLSCNKVSDLADEPSNYGKLLFPSTEVSGVYESANGDQSQVSYNVQDFIVSIHKYDGTNLVAVDGKKWKVSEMPSKVGLTVGKYALHVASYDGKQQTFGDTPYFFGTIDFGIAVDIETQLALAVGLADAKITVESTDAFELAFTDWALAVSSGTEALCTLDPQTTVKYLKPTDLTLKMNGQRRNSAIAWDKTISVPNVVAADWIKVVLDIDPVGTVTVAVTIDNTLNERDVTITIPNDDEDLGDGGTETPEPEKPDEPDPVYDKPNIVGLNDLDVSEVLVLSKATDFSGGMSLVPVEIEINAENGGIQKLLVTIESQEEWFMVAVRAMFEGSNSFDLANLVNGSDTRENLITVGVIDTTTSIKNEQSFTFDITGFMSLLSVNNPATNSYDFTIKVTDGVGDTATEKLVVRITN